MRLRAQFLLSHLTVVLSVALFIAASVFFLIRHLTVQMLDEEQDRQMRSFTQACRQSALQKNDILLAGHVKLAGEEPAVSYAYFADAGGRIRMHTDPRFIFKPESSWTPQDSPGEAVEHRGRVTAADGGVLGTAVIGFDQTYRREILSSSTRRLALWIALGAAIGAGLGLLIATALSARLARPLRDMAAAAREIGAGRFETKVEVHSSRELETLGDSLNRMGDQLKHLEDLRTEFMAVVSHDLLSPLGAIVTAADYLKESAGEGLDKDQRDCMEAIAEKGMQVAHFAVTLLDLAKVRGGKMEYMMRPLNATEMLQRLSRFYHPTARRQGADIVCDAPPGLTIVADEEKIERALTNLLSNALKFAPRPNGRVTLTAAPEGGGALFTVADNGPGIPPEDQARLFQKYTRLHADEQAMNKITGNGIGLSITKEIVEGHGGRIWVESAPGRGTRFLFRLPPAQPSPPPPPK